MGRRTTSDADRARAARLAADLESARRYKQLSVDDLARASGVHYETVRAVLGGRSAGPSFFIVADLARALRTPLGRLARTTQR